MPPDIYRTSLFQRTLIVLPSQISVFSSGAGLAQAFEKLLLLDAWSYSRYQPESHLEGMKLQYKKKKMTSLEKE